uniref:Reverse transcriptase domain-containing protein n=1 Tax=Tanacetum cinerariifolium TaxID=118510 RepID=A0A699GMJ0_TANCI|nr:reverse transcriptase domain-containing protein [Tanacetum cinerariifolium]
MSSSNYPIIVPSYSDIKDAFSSTNTPDYTSASPDYFPASPGNTFFDPSEDLSKYLLASLAILPFHDESYMKVMQAYNPTSNESLIPLPQALIAPPTILPSPPVLSLSPMGKLIQKLLLNQKCMGYLVRAYYSIFSTKYYKDESCWNADVKSKTTEDIISNRSFIEVLVLNHYVLIKNVLALQKLVPKSKQQCPWKSILAEGQELSPTSKCSHGFVDVIGMDWLSKYHARIICDKKVVYIPIDDETLIIRAQVMEKKTDEKRQEDITVVREFLKVFPEDLPGLPPVCQVEFLINLIPGVAPVARAPYRLALLEMQELSNQLQELADRGFIRPTQTKAIKEENIDAENLQRMDKAFKVRLDGTRYIKNRSWLPLFGNLRDLIMHESHKSKYSIHPGSDKIMLEAIWLIDTTRDSYMEIGNNNDGLRYKTTKTSNRHDIIWVIVDRLTKSAHFISTREINSMETLARLYIKEIVSRHGVPISIISDHDSHFTSRFWQSMQSALGTQLEMSAAYHPEIDGQSERTIQTLEECFEPVL